ncbi:hypothetical protein [Olivibacter domesticus]|uniref:Uncharacterized protein n=1 Tax=Olivibacter domesticus TaxID=407022 RepID=A0A1H7IK34_OLID1|nr:hypothetical protein [Olivibacter domesticus]SEK62222.1 hypothetical protein SAMN05661044_00715 [Olivibacter domesticus]
MRNGLYFLLFTTVLIAAIIEILIDRLAINSIIGLVIGIVGLFLQVYLKYQQSRTE